MYGGAGNLYSMVCGGSLGTSGWAGGFQSVYGASGYHVKRTAERLLLDQGCSHNRTLFWAHGWCLYHQISSHPSHQTQPTPEMIREPLLL